MIKTVCSRCFTEVQIEKLCRCPKCRAILIKSDISAIEISDLQKAGVYANELYSAIFVELRDISPIATDPIRAKANTKLVQAAIERRKPKNRPKQNSCFLILGTLMLVPCICSVTLYLIGQL
jgi:hypothetical protein